MRNIDELKTTLKKDIDKAETLLHAWEAVERVTKKDGGDFAALAKNFKNASVYDSGYSLVATKEITVSGWSQFSGWISDKIENREIARYSKRTVSDDRIIKETCLEPYFYKTVSEIFEDIETRKEQLKKQIADYKRDLENAKKLFDSFKTAIDAALVEMKTNCTQHTYYLIRDYMKSAY